MPPDGGMPCSQLCLFAVILCFNSVNSKIPFPHFRARSSIQFLGLPQHHNVMEQDPAVVASGEVRGVPRGLWSSVACLVAPLFWTQGSLRLHWANLITYTILWWPWQKGRLSWVSGDLWGWRVGWTLSRVSCTCPCLTPWLIRCYFQPGSPDCAPPNDVRVFLPLLVKLLWGIVFSPFNSAPLPSFEDCFFSQLEVRVGWRFGGGRGTL